MLSGIKDDAKISFFVGVGLIVVVFLAALYWLLKKDYQPLFAELQPEDTAAMIEELDKIEANYRINQDTGALEVPSNNIHSTRLKLMGSDLPLKGSVGYEVFDNSDFGMTEFAQKINHQRALEGELQRTITSLEQVKYARVHLVMPDRELFRDAKQEPTASVTLLLQDGFDLNSEEIVGIQRLVSASVPKLKATMVTISDHLGKTLTQTMPAEKSVQMVPWKLQQKINAEAYMVKKIQKVLSKAFNVEQISVSVNMEMDFSQIKKVEEKVLPLDEGRAISREKESRLGGQNSKKGSQNITREVEYEMGKSIAEIVESPGRIKKINVGVMLPVSLSEDKVTEIKRLIEVTAGIEVDRGDSIAIYSYNAANKYNDAMGQTVIESASSVDASLASKETVISFNDSKQPSVFNNNKTATDAQIAISLFKKYWFYALLMFVIFSVVILIVLTKSGRGQQQRKLSADEREKVLMQLQHWLGEAK